MTREFLKQASKTSTSDAGDVRDVVQGILDDIERSGDEAAKKYAAKFDDYDGNLLLSEEEVAKAATQVRKSSKMILHLRMITFVVLPKYKNKR